MKNTLILFALALLLVACGLVGISPENQNALMQHFHEELAAGRITQAQYDVLVESLTTPKMDWKDYLLKALEWAGLITGAVFATNKTNQIKAAKAVK